MIREDKRNMFLLATVTLCCAAGTLALLGPDPGQIARQVADQSVATDNRGIAPAPPEPVRVVGAPFIPNVNPSQR
jgi:hypothetical protein